MLQQLVKLGCNTTLLLYGGWIFHSNCSNPTWRRMPNFDPGSARVNFLAHTHEVEHVEEKFVEPRHSLLSDDETKPLVMQKSIGLWNQ